MLLFLGYVVSFDLLLIQSVRLNEAQEFLVEEHGFLPLLFERDGDGNKIAGIVAPVGKSDGYTIGFYNIN